MRMHGTKRPDGTAMPYVTTASENAAKAYAMSAADAKGVWSWNSARIVCSVGAIASVPRSENSPSPQRHCSYTLMSGHV